jgi:peroxiredoxin
LIPRCVWNNNPGTRENKLSFPILSDEKGKVGEAFGLKFALPDYLG